MLPDTNRKSNCARHKNLTWLLFFIGEVKLAIHLAEGKLHCPQVNFVYEINLALACFTHRSELIYYRFSPFVSITLR